MPQVVWHLIVYCYLSSIVDYILKNHNFQDNLSAVLIIKDEASYIEEWIDFHCKVGFTKFYIYDNGSMDGLENILSQYINSGMVKYIYFPGKAKQAKAYTHAVRKYRWKTKYMAMFDTDEFIYPCRNDEKLIDIIDAIMKENPRRGGVGINLRWYGSAGYIKKPEGKVTENFLYRADDFWNENRACSIIKTVCNPRKVFLFEQVCYPMYNEKFYCVNEKGVYVEGAWTEIPSFDHIRINHYWAKSKEEFLEKQKRGNASTGVKNDKTWELYDLYNRNEKYDASALRIWKY